MGGGGEGGLADPRLAPWATFFRPLRGLTYSTDFWLRTLADPQDPSFLTHDFALVFVIELAESCEPLSQPASFVFDFETLDQVTHLCLIFGFTVTSGCLEHCGEYLRVEYYPLPFRTWWKLCQAGFKRPDSRARAEFIIVAKAS